MSEWFRPAGSATGRGGFDVAIEPQESGWEFAGLNVLTLAPGESRRISTGGCEWLVLPLAGQTRVECGDRLLLLGGRTDVFAGPTDFAYVPVHSKVTVSSIRGARLALPHARAAEALPFRRIGAEHTYTELHGTGHSSRQVRCFGTPSVLNADAIIACEVLTPAGNWSSWPPQKHDERHLDRESVLEAICYYEMRPEPGAPAGADPVGYQRVYGTRERPINVLAEIRGGDVVLVPHGYQGPTMAPPGYDLYCLQVMAGPGPNREWLTVDDPAHGWVRARWASQKVDPRLPFEGHR